MRSSIPHVDIAFERVDSSLSRRNVECVVPMDPRQMDVARAVHCWTSELLVMHSARRSLASSMSDASPSASQCSGGRPLRSNSRGGDVTSSGATPRHSGSAGTCAWLLYATPDHWCVVYCSCASVLDCKCGRVYVFVRVSVCARGVVYVHVV